MMQALWGEAVRSVEERVKPTQRDQWLRPITFVGFEGSRIRLRAPNRYQKEWFEDHYLPAILSDLAARTQTNYAVDFEVEEEMTTTREMPIEATSEPIIEVPSSTVPPKGLDRRYTFDKFVVGQTNQFAHAAARMVAEA